MSLDQGMNDDAALPWMIERKALFDLYNRDRLAAVPRPRGGRVPLSLARAQARACEARPEIMRAWASAPPEGKIPDEQWDLITDFTSYLWVKSGCSQDMLAGIGAAVRRVANREFESVESEAFIEHLLRDPRIVDDRGTAR